MEVLVHLARAGGRVVSKKELFESVWGGVAVTDDVLRRCIYNLRQALGDDSDDPRYIRTLPRRGYRLVAEISRPAATTGRAVAVSYPAPGGGQTDAAAGKPGARRPRPLRRRVAVAVTLVVVAAGAFAILGGTMGTGATSPNPNSELLLANESPLPTTAEDFFNLGVQHAAQRGGDDFERAIELFNRAIELDPDHARAHAELANVYALSVSGYFRDPGRLDLAIDHATIALGRDPEMAEANKAMGIAFASKGWLTSAAREYERALRLRPGYQAAINNLALVEVRRGHLDRALHWQRQLDNAVPTRSLHLNNLGHTYRLLGDYPTARRMLEASLETMPDNANAAANLALIDLAEGNLVAAGARMRDTVPLYPTDARFLATAGLIELAVGETRAAEELFRTSIDLSANGTNNNAWLGLAYLHLQRDEHQEAEDIFAGFYTFAEESRRRRREDWGPAYNLTAIHAMSGRIDEALVELERAVSSGFVDYRFLDNIPFFRKLHDNERYRAIVSEVRDRVAGMRNEATAAGAR